VKTKKPVIIVLGEPNSVFIEILSKVLKKTSVVKKLNYPLIIIGSKKLIISQLNLLRSKINFESLFEKELTTKFKNKVYLIDVKYKFTKPFEKISYNSKNYISECFKIALEFVDKGISDIIVNGPISKKHFLQNKYPGITEYIYFKSKKKISNNPVMLIYNKKLSVSPLTTHIPLKNVNKKIKLKTIINNVLLINNFYKKKLKVSPKIAITGLNPHCETSSKFSEELRIIKPAIKKLRKQNINILGPYPTDTFFLKENLKYFNVLVGMYHDQILTPFKTLFGFDASNITLGLPFLRLSVDHGPNNKMIGKNKSSTSSLENIFKLIHSLK